MGFLDFFKRKRKPGKPANSDERLNISTTDNFLMVSSIDFFGPFSRSPNGKYIVGHQDSDYRNKSKGGFRKSGNGRCVLVEGQRLLYQIDMERPWTTVVSDTGIVALYDIGFAGTDVGTFHVLGPKGTGLLKHQVQARDSVCGLSPTDDLAWLHTGFQKCLVFSLNPPELLFEIEIFDPPQNIERNGDHFEVAYRGANRMYDIDGALLNYREIVEDEVRWVTEHGNQYELESKAGELLEAVETGTLDSGVKGSVRFLLEAALKKTPDNWHKAKVHRKLGELAESLDDKVEALKQYTPAIEYDPKVGCKRALGRLEKELG